MSLPIVSWIVVGVALASLPTSLEAKWRYADWGASPQQVVSASHGAAHLVATDHDPKKKVFGGDLEANGVWSDDGVAYDVKFYFWNERLIGVKLVLRNAEQCEDAFLALRQRLGKATRKSELGSDIWDLPGTGDKIRAVDLRHESPLITDCFVTYEELTPQADHSLQYRRSPTPVSAFHPARAL